MVNVDWASPTRQDWQAFEMFSPQHDGQVVFRGNDPYQDSHLTTQGAIGIRYDMQWKLGQARTQLESALQHNHDITQSVRGIYTAHLGLVKDYVALTWHETRRGRHDDTADREVFTGWQSALATHLTANDLAAACKAYGKQKAMPTMEALTGKGGREATGT